MLPSLNKLFYTTNTTPDGKFHIIFDMGGVARASGFGDVQELRKRLPGDLRASELEYVQNHPYQKYADAYYDGQFDALDAISRKQEGSDFQKRVWQAMSAIPPGETMSYKQLAEAAGNPAAIRAAGTICGLNRLILLVPCHRILKSDGSIGSYLYGSEIKASLLHHEGALKD